MSDQPLVTIYVPCRNYGHFLAQALESVLSQLYANWELLVIDEGSTDDTAAIARSYADRHPERIRFIRNEQPQGLQKVANAVLRIARGNFIMRLDGDDWLDEAALLVLVTRALGPGKPAVVFGSYYYASEDGRVVGLERQPRLWDDDRSGINPPHGACTLVRTRSLRAARGYSEDINAQDGWELWFKLVGRVNTASVTTPIFFYRQHSASLSRNGERLYDARAKIFSRLRERLQGSYDPRVLAVVPVRESYPHMQGVPYTMVGGRSLLERAVAEAQAVPTVSEVMVSTDSQAVLDFGALLEQEGKVGPHTSVLRPEALNGAHVHLLQILEHAGEHFCERHGAAPDIVLFLNLHAVMRTATAIAKAVDTLLVTECDTVVSVVEERDPIFVHSEMGLRLIGNGRFDNLFHRNEQMLRFNGSIIATWWDVVEQQALWGGRTGFIEMTPLESQIFAGQSTLPGIEEALRRVGRQ